MRALCLLLIAAALASLLPAAAPPRSDPRLLPGDAHDVVLLHPSRPYRVRFHLQPAGRAFLDSWRARVDVLFAHLDADGNGKLDRTEVRAAPSRAQWAQLLHGERGLEPDAAPDFDDLAAKATEVKADQLAAYYQGSVGGPLRVRWVRRHRGGDPISAALWKRLDTDRDGKLSRAELLAAPRVLAALDRDDDELVSAFELAGYSGVETVGSDGQAHGAAPDGLPFVSLRPGGQAGPLVEAMLAAYDRDRDGKLTQREVGLGAAGFRRLDRDRDGKLDRAELAAWVDFPPDASVIVPLEGDSQARVEVVAGSAPGVVVRPERDGIGLIFGDHAVAVRRGEGGRPPVAPALAATADVFRRLDRNDNGFLESKEVLAPPFSHVAWLRLADRDGDGRISRKEFDAFVTLQRRLRGAATFLRVESEGGSLFELLDADGDGSLSPRERRSAWERLSPWFDGRKGALVVAEVPRQFRVTIAHGFEPVAGRPLPHGPLWFRKMDRNRDGDVSRAEWLGNREQFSAIDVDGDGLISPEEAERADRKARAKER